MFDTSRVIQIIMPNGSTKTKTVVDMKNRSNRKRITRHGITRAMKNDVTIQENGVQPLIHQVCRLFH